MGGQSADGIVSLPIGLDTDAVNSGGTAALIGVGTDLDFYEAGIFAFGDFDADFMGGHFEYGSEFVGDCLGVLYDTGFGEDRLDFVTGGEDTAAGIEDGTALGLLGYAFLLLFE